MRASLPSQIVRPRLLTPASDAVARSSASTRLQSRTRASPAAASIPPPPPPDTPAPPPPVPPASGLAAEEPPQPAAARTQRKTVVRISAPDTAGAAECKRRRNFARAVADNR